MAILVECDGCGKKYRVGDQMAGQSVSCRECGMEIDVPGGRRSRGKSSGSVRRPAGRSPSRSSGGVPAGVIWGGAAVVGLVLLLGMGVLMVKLISGGAREQPLSSVGQDAPIGGRTNAGGQTAPSRFDTIPQATAPASTAPASPGFQGPKNPNAGIGFGNVVSLIRSRSATGRPAEYEVLKDDPDDTLPNFWDVKPDPPQEPFTFDPKGRVRIQIPAGSFRTTDDVLLPVVHSPVVAVGQNSTPRDTREIWDMSTNQRIGTIKGSDFTSRTEALSPDGLYLAFVPTGAIGNSGIVVWDVKQRKGLGSLPLEKSIGGPSLLAFPRSDRLVAGGGMNTPLRVWEIPSGEKLHDIELDYHSLRDSVCFSPGGRYLAIGQSSGLHRKVSLIDLEQGAPVGDLAVPDYEVPGGLRMQGMAFSTDGTELAGLFDSWECSKIFIWKLEDGSIVDHMTFPNQLQKSIVNTPLYKGPAIAWFPGNQRLLAYEHGVIDRQTGLLVLTIPKSNVDPPGKRRPLDENRVSVLDLTGNVRSVMIYTLPKDKLDEAVARAAGSVQREEPVPSVDVPLPPLTVPHPASMKYVVAAPAATWSVQSDPAPPSSAHLLDRPLPLVAGRGTLQQFHVSGPEASRAAVLRSTVWVPFPRIPHDNITPDRLKSLRWHSVGREKNPRVWIDVYDLADRKRTLQLRPQFDCDLLGVSSDGALLLLWAADESSRLDIYATEDGRHVGSWQPYGGERGDPARQLTGAAFVGADRVATLSGAGKLIVWEVPSLRPLYAVDNVSQPSFSPGGNYLGFADAENYHLLDLAAGEIRGSVPDVGKVQAAGWHPGGERLAVFTEHNGGFYVIPVDLQSGQVAPPIPVPIGGSAVHWCGDRYVLLNNERLLDLESRTVAWSYQLPTGGHLPQSPDGRHWYLTLEEAGPPMLAAVELPGPGAQAQLARTTLQPEYILQPGGKVSLSLELIDPPGKPNFRKEVHDALVQALAKNQITVADNQPVTLAVTMKLETGERVDLEFKKFGSFERQQLSVQQKSLTTKAAYVHQGESLWERSSRSSNVSFGILSLTGNETPEQALEKQFWNTPEYFFQSLVVPPYAFSSRTAKGLGETTFTATGLGP